MEDNDKTKQSINIEGDAKNSVIVSGTGNVVKTIKKIYSHNPWLLMAYSLAIISVVTLLVLVGINNFLKYDTSYMSGQLNIVVVPFLDEKNGQLRSSEQGLILAQYFYAQLEDEVTSGEFEQDTNIKVDVRGPQESPPLRYMNWVGVDDAAQNIASEINAHIVVFGLITYDEFNRPYASIRFYVSPDQFGDAQEILGENELGNPILLTGNLQSGTDIEGENEELRNRIQVVSLLMKAIGAYVGEDFPKSLDYLNTALSDDLWKQTSGREVVYLLAGNVVSRQALPVLLEEGESRGVETIQLAEEYYNLAIQSAKQKGDYARAYIGLAGVQNFYAIYKARLTSNLDDVDFRALEKEEEYLKRALFASYKPQTADIVEKVAFNRAQVFLLRNQLSGIPSELDQAEINYQIVVDSYNSGNARVRELAAHSYSGLALVARARGEIDDAIREYDKAFGITRIPSLQALYLYHIGNVYYESGEFENAVKYYTSALEMREDLAKRISEDQIQIIEDRIEEINSIHTESWHNVLDTSVEVSTLYTNETIPFEKPANKGKIAVKVINHYGDEVLKVYEV